MVFLTNRVWNYLAQYYSRARFFMGVMFSCLIISAGAQAATFTVNSTLDTSDASAGNGTCATAGGVCTLRAAVEEANATAAADTIQFDNTTFASNTAIAISTTTLSLTTNGGITIDGTANGVTAHNVIVNGAGTSGIDCFTINTPNNVIIGLTIQDCRYGIYFNSVSATGNKIKNNYIGTDYIGTTSGVNNQHSTGIYLNAGDSNIIGTEGDNSNDSTEGNVISGNATQQIYVGTSSNVIAGNIVGPGSNGTTDLGIGNGINIQNTNNRIGTNGDNVSDASERNVISGFNGAGANYGITVPSFAGTVIAGNYIGLTAAGTAALPNSYGVYLTGTAAVTVGVNGDGSAGEANEGNYIAGNGSFGIYVTSTGAHVIAGNVIGLDTGGTARSNNTGVYFNATGSSYRIGTNADGTSDALERNIISGNAGSGISVDSSAAGKIKGNYIGLNAAGTASRPNSYGISLNTTGAWTIGTDGDGAGDSNEGNYISGNSFNGVDVASTGAHVIAGNIIGLDTAGTARANVTGVYVSTGTAVTYRIGTNGDGTSDAAERNIISGNSNTGIFTGSTSAGKIKGNYIGLDSAGTASKPNTTYGIHLNGTAAWTVGTDGDGTGDANEGNYITSSGSGIFIASTGAHVIAGNVIGLDTAGTVRANTRGINVNATGSSYRIGTDGNGTSDTLERNIISGNTTYGIFLDSSSAGKIKGNYIGLDSAGTAAKANGTGIWLTGTSAWTVGTDGDGTGDANEGNIIAANTTHGINILSSGAVVIAGNTIGLDAAATIRNNGNGINFGGAGTSYRVGTNANGTSDALERNIISGNNIGIVTSSTSGGTIAGNYIGTDGAGTSAKANGAVGVSLGGTGNWTIGTNGDGSNDTAERNVISGNGNAGVYVTGTASVGNNIIAGNYIGTGSDGSTDLGHGMHGISVDWAANVVIGGDIAAEENLIRFNGDGNSEYGVYINGSTATGVTILRNSVYDNQTTSTSNADWSIANATTAPTAITTTQDGSNQDVTITAVNGNVIHLYKDTDGDSTCETMTYLGTGTISGTTVTVQDISGLASGNRITAMAKGSSNTSAPSSCIQLRTIAFTATSSSGGEGTTSVNIAVSLNTATSDNGVAVAYSVTGGTATGSGTDYTLASGTATVTTGQSSVNIPVTIVDDTHYEASETIQVTLAASVTNGILGGNTVHTYTITENDSQPSVILSVDNAAIAENGSTATFTATLSNLSYQNVTVNLGYTGTATLTSDYTRSGTSITVTAGNPTGTATITSATDTLDENDETVIIDVSSVTNGTESGTQQQSTTITDDDAAPTVSLSVNNATIAENGSTALFTATLSAVSGKDITVNLAYSGTATLTSDYTRSGTSIPITAGNTTGAVTVGSTADVLDEDDETVILDISSVDNATESGTQQQTTAITDDDASPTVTLGLNNASIDEAGSVATFTATLSAASGRPVTVNLDYTGTATLTNDYTRSGTAIVIAGDGSTLAGTATVTSITDVIDEADETVVVAVLSVINGIESGTQQQSTTITDDDTAGVTVSHSGGNTQVTEGGSTDTYTLVLTSEPTADVTLNLTTGTQVTTNVSSVVFTSLNWNQAQTLTVTAANDAVAEGLHGAAITHAASGADPTYTALAISSLAITITDNDSAGVSVTETGGSTQVTEGGNTDTYTIVLTSQPTFDVTITPNFGSGVSLNLTTLTFTSSNWNTAQMLTVTAVDDRFAEGAHIQSITHAGASSDANYSGVGIVSLTVAITDNDTAGVQITESTGGTVVGQSGDVVTSDTYTMVLTSQPSGTVTVLISFETTLEVSPVSVSFTTSNWNSPVTVAVELAETEDSSTASTITHQVSSSDTRYHGATVSSVVVTINRDASLAADAGDDRTIYAGSSATLDGSESSGRNLSYAWEIVDGAGSLSGAQTATPTFASESDAEGRVVVKLSVRDGHGSEATDTVNINVVRASAFGEEVLAEAIVAFSGSTALQARQTAAGIILEPIGTDVEILLDANTEDYVVESSSRWEIIVGEPDVDGSRGQVSFIEQLGTDGSVNLGRSTGSQALVVAPDVSLGMPMQAASIDESLVTISGNQASDRFGEYIGIGDMDGDGLEEVIIAAPGASHYGVVYIYDATLTLLGFIVGSADQPISSVFTAQFLQADSRDDLVFGPNNPGMNGTLQRQENLAGSDMTSRTSAISGTNDFNQTIDLQAVSADATLGGSESYASVAIGDVNADGDDDLLMCGATGTAWLFFGPLNNNTQREANQADVVIGGGGSSDGFCRMAAIGDVTGDAINDIVIGAPEAGGGLGKIYVIFGGADWSATLDLATSARVVVATGKATQDRIGSDLLLHDQDGDDTSEIFTIKGSSDVYVLSLTGALRGEDGDAGSVGGGINYNAHGGGCALQPETTLQTNRWVWLAALLGALGFFIWRRGFGLAP